MKKEKNNLWPLLGGFVLLLGIIMAVSTIEFDFFDGDLPKVENGIVLNPAALAAAELAEEDTGADIDELRVISVNQMEWNDACLGVQLEGVLCAQVITPGYLIAIEHDDVEYRYHTNELGTVIERGEVIGRIDSPMPNAAIEETPENLGIRGVVTQVNLFTEKYNKTVATILVEGERDAGFESDKAMISIKENTVIKGDGFEGLFGDFVLNEGQIVDVYYVGPVKESYPIQVDAGKIVIIE